MTKPQKTPKLNEIDYKCEYLNKVKEIEAYRNTFELNRCWLCGDTNNLTKHHLQQTRKRKIHLKQIPLCKDCHVSVEKLRQKPRTKALIEQATITERSRCLKDEIEFLDNLKKNADFNEYYMQSMKIDDRIKQLKERIK